MELSETLKTHLKEQLFSKMSQKEFLKFDDFKIEKKGFIIPKVQSL